MEINSLPKLFNQYKESSLFGRYIHTDHIAPILERSKISDKVSLLGNSEKGLPIYKITIGTGDVPILLWSQMHGNESTTTKALFDLINLLIDPNSQFGKLVLETCTLHIVPILNPDGAKEYTRLNGNGVDLNRDAQNLTQIESKILNRLIHAVKPQVACNLHGQRTIFSVGQPPKPASVSFLSAAGDPDRSLTPSRKTAMQLIVGMHDVLQHFIPNQIGRYDDTFNLNCTGDTLTYLGIPVILFEAGHVANDYDRESTRAYIFYAILSLLDQISNSKTRTFDFESYFDIPENEKLFLDILIKNVQFQDEIVDIGVQYKETLVEDSVRFVPTIMEVGKLNTYKGHREIEGNERKITTTADLFEFKKGFVLDSFCLENEKFSMSRIKN